MGALLLLAGGAQAQGPVRRGTGGTQPLHRLQVCEDGAMMGWGDNSNYVLAQPSAGSSYPSPIQIYPAVPGADVLYNQRIAEVAWASSSSFAIRNDGVPLAWGDNTYGQLGLGTWPGAPTFYATPMAWKCPGRW